jgi:AraC-like DNA-binding protein
MASAGSEIPTLKFSTEDYSERDRSAAWREFFGRKLVQLEIEPLADRTFVSGGTVRLLPDLAVLNGSCSGAHYRMTKPLIASDDIAVVFSDVELWRAEQCGREALLQRGDAVLMTNAEPGDLVNASPRGEHGVGPSPYRSLRIPRRTLARLVPDIEGAAARPIASRSEALRMLVAYLRIVENPPEIASPEARQLAATHIHDLVALAVGAGRDAAEVARGRGLSAARLRAAKAIVDGELDNPDLAVGTVAGRLGVSPRYLQMLFERDGTTFSEYLLGRRLLRVHHWLSDPRFSGLTVSDLAFDAGFGGLAHFNRMFRRAYGATPSDVRAFRRN